MRANSRTSSNISIEASQKLLTNKYMDTKSRVRQWKTSGDVLCIDVDELDYNLVGSSSSNVALELLRNLNRSDKKY